MPLSEVIMPKTGAEMEAGKIISWKKQPGERIAAGDILLEIETDKATMEVESPANGVLLRQLFPVGESVPATRMIAVIGEGSESAAEIDAFVQGVPPAGAATAAPVPSGGAQPTSAAAPRAESPGGDQRVKASPLARRLAQEKGMDLAAIQGSGPDGRIEKDDVLRAAKAKATAPAPPPTPVSAEVVPLTSMRRAIARTVALSKREIPEFSITMPMEMAAALRRKSALNAAGIAASVNDLILFAVARALTAHPDLTSLLEGDSLRRREINVGFALGTDDGLFLPVIHGADKLSIEEIAAATARFVAKAGSKQLTEGDLLGGTFSVSNLGMFGVESFTAIIPPSQAAILSVGAVADQARRGENDSLTWQQVMAATLTVDHRVADGVAAARFLGDLRTLLMKF
jgi:pyruvate dehydrogenase E2 component (dihydrolipoamide acetyltransferase)